MEAQKSHIGYFVNNNTKKEYKLGRKLLVKINEKEKMGFFSKSDTYYFGKFEFSGNAKMLVIIS